MLYRPNLISKLIKLRVRKENKNDTQLEIHFQTANKYDKKPLKLLRLLVSGHAVNLYFEGANGVEHECRLQPRFILIAFQHAVSRPLLRPVAPLQLDEPVHSKPRKVLPLEQ